MIRTSFSAISVLVLLTMAPTAPAQRGGFGPGGPGGPGGPNRETVKLVEQFDENNNGYLERTERDAARAWLKENGNQRRRRGPRGFGRSGNGGNDVEPESGPAVAPDSVDSYPDLALYDTTVLRTFFLEFGHDDWETEMAELFGSDVEIPATLMVEGQRLEQVGVRFRGNTSFMMVQPGQKRPLNLSLDLVNKDQRLHGYKTLNLLNCHSDPSLLREVLHAHIGRQFSLVPQANLVHVVINGKSWGVFANVQQTNRDYQKEAFGTRKGARWRVPPSFDGSAGLAYLGDDHTAYEKLYQAKSGVDDEAQEKLVELCRVLNETTVEQRRTQLPDLLHIDDALWFLAIDNVLLDGDGYLTRASDYVLYLDPTGVFHPITYDNNEILRGSAGGRGMRGRGFRPPGGPPGDDRGGQRGRNPFGGDPRGGGRRRGGRGGPGGGIDPTQSPLAGSDNEDRPLLHGLLEVPEWRARYLAHVHRLAQAIEWARLGPEVERLHGMVADITGSSTRELYGAEAFDGSVDDLRKAIEKRLEALNKHATLIGPWPAIDAVEAEEQKTSAGPTLLVSARVGDGVEIGEAILHWQLSRPGPFTTVQMERGDDGVFRAATPPLTIGEKIHYYVEVRAADSDRLAFHPAGAASNAAPHRFER